MRPKKIILCVDPNENDLGTLAFMLSTNAYRVLAARTADEAIALYSEYPVELVLASYVMPPAGGNALVRKLKQIAHHVPAILLGDPMKMAEQVHCADALLSKKNLYAADLLERIRVMTVRKRGPRKGSFRMPPAAAALPAPAVLEARRLA